MKKSSLYVALAILPLGSLVSQAQNPSAVTDPVGFVSVTVPAQSDAVLAVPLYRAAEFRGVIQSISGTTLTVVGTPAWAANQFVQTLPSQTKTYAVLIASGSKEGLIAKVTANAANTLTVTLDSGDDLTDIKTETTHPGAADQIDVMPYWTPGSLFAGASIPQGTQILSYTDSGAGVNRSSSASFGFDSGGWINESTFDNADNQVFPFGSAFVLRNTSVAPLSISMVGSVPMSRHRARIKTLALNTDQDIRIGYSCCIP